MKTRGLDKRGNLLVFIYLTKTFDINFLPVGYPCTSNRLQSPLYFVQSTAANEVDGYNRRTNFSLTRWCKRELIPWKITSHQEYTKIALSWSFPKMNTKENEGSFRGEPQ